jgi:hypothetical protein
MQKRTVSLVWKDSRDGGRTEGMAISGGAFLHRFTRDLVAKRIRRAPSFGVPAGAEGHRELPGAPARSIGEKAAATPDRPA